MEKIKSLNLYQKGILILMVVMVLVFTVLYPITISHLVFEYNGASLVPTQENGSTVYSGKIRGQSVQFTVLEDKTVIYKYGDKTYAPYTLKEDPTAIPKNDEMAEYMTGVELHQGENVLFRGGALDTGDSFWLYNEDGTLYSLGFSYGDGIEDGENGDIMGSEEPSVSTILELMNDPQLTHKGEWLGWFGAVFICVINALIIFFADELFRWNLAFQIRNADRAEPTDFEMAGRYVSWTVLTIIALILFVIGLQ